jgi:hypothetical protein
MDLLDLPDELLCKILSYFEGGELIKVLDTCRHLRNFKNDKAIWSRFYEPWLLDVFVKLNCRLFIHPYCVRVCDEETEIITYKHRNNVIVAKGKVCCTHDVDSDSYVEHQDMIL